MATKTRRKLTAAQEEARKAERAARVEMLKSAAETYEFDEDNSRTVRAFESLTKHYSEGNALLILSQAENLGLPVKGLDDVGGYGAFAERGRQVRKGEHHSLFIWAPAGTSADADREDTTTTTEGQTVRRFFRVAGLFHISQTDKIEA